MEIIVGLFVLLLWLVLAAIGLGIYLLPAIIGFVRKKDNKIAILLLNIFLGWSLIAWVVALVWAVSKDSEPKQIIINNTSTQGSSTESK